MRDPILNIKRSDLEKILKNFNVSDQASWYIMKEAKKYKVNYEIDAKAFMSYNKIAEAEHADKFNMMFMSALQKLKLNPNAALIKKQDSAYSLLKEISILAQDFCKINDIPIDEGFYEYILAGLSLMGKKYGLNKFKYYHQKILSGHEEKGIIRNNELTKETALIAKLYKTLGKTTTKTSDTIHFIRTAQEIVENSAQIEDWMKAQFEGLEWTGKIPEVNQLYGSGAKKRWEKIKPTERIIKLRKEADKDEQREKRDWFADK